MIIFCCELHVCSTTISCNVAHRWVRNFSRAIYSYNCDIPMVDKFNYSKFNAIDVVTVMISLNKLYFAVNCCAMVWSSIIMSSFLNRHVAKCRNCSDLSLDDKNSNNSVKCQWCRITLSLYTNEYTETYRLYLIKKEWLFFDLML